MLARLIFVFALLSCGMARADMILILSDEKPSIAGVAHAIQTSYPGKLEIHNLGGSREKENQVADAVLESHAPHVVAVGLQAALLARNRLSSKQVVFCQVLNFEEFDLITPWMKGVSAIPSLSRQFGIWKLLDPSLRRIGIITGRNSRYMIAEAEAAAKRHGLELVHEEAASERAVPFAAQFLYEKKIQGIWLAPDSSILSQRAVLDLMSFSAKNKLQVLAFSPALLKEGALISTTPDFQEIARMVIDRFKKNGGDAGLPRENGIIPLETAKIIINSNVASRFGLGITSRLKGQADVQ